MDERLAPAGGPDLPPAEAPPRHGRLNRFVDRAAATTAERRFSGVFLGALALLSGAYLAFVASETGQRLENLALRGAELRSDAEREAGLQRLSQVSIAIFGVAVVAIVAVGLLRRRPVLGIAVGALMSASVLAVELLKAVLPRPQLVEGPAWLLRNSFPSGSAAVAAAMAVGAILVSPDRLRWFVVPVGAAWAAIVGDTIQTTGWHRLSDSLGAVLVVIAVGSAGLAVLARAGLVQPSEHGRIDRRIRTVLLLAALAAAATATVVLAVASVFPLLTAPDDGRRAFLQTAFPLLSVAFVTAAIVAFAWVVEPYTLGRGRPPGDEPAAAS
ncbi:MAG TPA: phosphatase PAP2 family protein [Candidatus Deferrimicrobium sp.]|nr:phosphatase PAP2 family protein [Candidatus Deferrimicrobium sp.]